jgi:hypothetical protein
MAIDCPNIFVMSTIAKKRQNSLLERLTTRATYAIINPTNGKQLAVHS